MSDLPTPEPAVNVETQPFWSAATEGRLVLARCDRCESVIWYPRQFCPRCHTTDVSWFDASGRGHVYSFTIVRQAPPPWRDSLPYVIAYVELDEGPRVLTNIVDVDVREVVVGAEVRVVFDRSAEGVGVPRFTLA